MNSLTVAGVASAVLSYPRLRYMGSKYKLVHELAHVFATVGGRTALDAFSGSGVISYALKRMGYAVTANDFLRFPSILASAAVVNQQVRLSGADIERLAGPPADDRDLIQSTFDGLYFDRADRAFLDSAWSHIDQLEGFKRDLAVSALVLSAARKQPRGVFTFTELRYDDGRRDLRTSMRDHFIRAAEDFNSIVFDGGVQCVSISSDIFDVEGAFDLVYLDPPYAPARDDNCYIKRYHFLEGLSVYWRGTEILYGTKTKKLAKRYTPFSYKRTVVEALRKMFKKFKDSTIVLSYSSNAVPDFDTIYALLREVKGQVEVRVVEHRYCFGTHTAAKRREVSEYIFIGR